MVFNFKNIILRVRKFWYHVTTFHILLHELLVTQEKPDIKSPPNCLMHALRCRKRNMEIMGQAFPSLVSKFINVVFNGGEVPVMKSRERTTTGSQISIITT